MSKLILNFSSHREGNCYHLARLVEEILGGEAKIVDFSDLDVHPCGKCSYDCFRGNRCPLEEDGIPGLYEAIDGAEEVIFIVPNYCGYPCGNFFAFNERGYSWFAGRKDRMARFAEVPKRFVVVSNSESHHFSEAFSYLVKDRNPEICYLATRKFAMNSFGGNLAQAPGVREILEVFLKK